MSVTPVEAVPVDVDAVVARFGDLPTLAPVAVAVLRLADDESAGLDAIAAVVSKDPGLAAQLLRVANSSMYGLGQEVTSLVRATTVLGLRTVRLLSLSFSVVKPVESGGAAGAELAWRRSLATSALARTIAEARFPRVAEECFVAGLLSNMGRIALLEEPSYAAVAEQARGWLDPEAEAATFGFTSDEVTRRVLDGWGLPEVLGEAIETRHTPPPGDGAAVEIARVLSVATAAAVLVTATDDDAPHALQECIHRADAHLGVSEDQLDGLLAEAQPALDDIATMFQVPPPTEGPVTELLLRAREGLARLSLDVVAALSVEQNRADQLATENERLASVAATDALTGLANRRTFDEFLGDEVAARARGTRTHSIGLLIMDLDRFKSLNDTHGHQVGDDVLEEVARRLAEATRRGELVARVGGEEFAVVMPVVSAEGAATAAERFRATVADTPVDTRIGPLAVTLSVGAACVADADADTASTLYRSADEALYAAKNAGRNQVRVAESQ